MRNRFLNIIAVMLAVIMFTLINAPAVPFAENYIEIAKPEIQVVNVTNETTKIDVNQVYAARFLNMLNHNFVYDEAYKSVEAIVNDSMPALIELRNAENDSFIAEAYVADYVFNMYGVEITDFSGINADFEKQEGYVYILPRGFANYNHTISSITQNEDGSFTVITEVEISSHDCGSYVDVCETLFVANELSQFGFSIIHSNIGGQNSAA